MDLVNGMQQIIQTPDCIVDMWSQLSLHSNVIQMLVIPVVSSLRIQWSQFKSYFLFKLEKVMDDFKASSPEQRGPANPNVEYIPFKEMKERILKIVDGYNG